MLVLEGIVGLHRAVQLQLLRHYGSGHRPGLLWYWMVYLGNEQRSFCHFRDCIQALHFWLFVDYDGYSISSKGFLPIVVDMMVIFVKLLLLAMSYFHFLNRCLFFLQLKKYLCNYSKCLKYKEKISNPFLKECVMQILMILFSIHFFYIVKMMIFHIILKYECFHTNVKFL